MDETLVTLMLNYVRFSSPIPVLRPWRDPKGYGFPGSAPFVESACFPGFSAGPTRHLVHPGDRHTPGFTAAHPLGFELSIIGASPKAARYQGIAVQRNILLAVLLSGAISGLAGACEVTGISHRLQQGLNIGYGFTAIIIAWMSQLNPLAIPFVALLMGGILVGGDQVQMMMGLPSAMGTVMQGLILFPMLAGSLFTEYRIRLLGRRHKRGKEACAEGEA